MCMSASWCLTLCLYLQPGRAAHTKADMTASVLTPQLSRRPMHAVAVGIDRGAVLYTSTRSQWPGTVAGSSCCPTEPSHGHQGGRRSSGSSVPLHWFLHYGARLATVS